LTFCTDFWAAYAVVLPPERHTPGEKGDDLTNHVERFFGTLGQRCLRFVRETLSFSKCICNHIGSLWYFIRHYNESWS
jgi:insertion element IS1 protein InsB